MRSKTQFLPEEPETKQHRPEKNRTCPAMVPSQLASNLTTREISRVDVEIGLSAQASCGESGRMESRPTTTMTRSWKRRARGK
jgi:hypothetical protein